MTGKVITEMKMNKSVQTIPVSGLPDGIYFIKYSDADRARTIKVNKP